jgi:enamine deaminase RidA (YjgF/YER057c/UK114 family)
VAGPRSGGMDRQRVSTGTEWEQQVGYSRAVRTGDTVRVAGTTATDEDGELVGVGDPHAQASQALANVQTALEEAGASLGDVVRTRIYVADADDWEAVGRAHGEYFAEVRPATTLVEVSRLVDPEMLVEVEAEAVVGGDR